MTIVVVRVTVMARLVTKVAVRITGAVAAHNDLCPRRDGIAAWAEKQSAGPRQEPALTAIAEG